MLNLLQIRRKLVKAASLARRKNWRRAAQKGVMAAIEHEDTLRAIKFDTLIDAGANKGQFTLLAREINPQVRVFAFDPLRESEAKFLVVHADASDVIFHRLGLGSKSESLTINVTQSNDSSSFFSPVESIDFGGRTQVVGEQIVSVRRLDSVLTEGDLRGRVLLKIDVQGFEKQVLIGAGDLLKRIDWIYVELSFIPFYENQPLFNEIHQFLFNCGFSPMKIGHVSGAQNNIQSVIDILYYNNNRQVPLSDEV